MTRTVKTLSVLVVVGLLTLLVVPTAHAQQQQKETHTPVGVDVDPLMYTEFTWPTVPTLTPAIVSYGLSRQAAVYAYDRVKVQRQEVSAAQTVEARRRLSVDSKRVQVAEFAVNAFMLSGDDTYLKEYNPTNVYESSRTIALVDTTTEVLEQQLEEVTAAHDRSVSKLRAEQALLALRIRDWEDQKTVTEQARAQVMKLTTQATAVRQRYQPQPTVAPHEYPVAGLSIPARALDSYLRTERLMALLDPECAVNWWRLAGFGLIESGHGTHGSASITEGGDVLPKVIGPQLDGTKYASIPDTDNGQFDFNTIWDHAVGPMQFIPSTWAKWGQDSNNDGLADPHNYYDAALASARYLCATSGGQGLATAEGFATAAFAYNHSDAYVASVTAAANRYSVVKPPNTRKVTIIGGPLADATAGTVTAKLAALGFEADYRTVTLDQPAELLRLLSGVSTPRAMFLLSEAEVSALGSARAAQLGYDEPATSEIRTYRSNTGTEDNSYLWSAAFASELLDTAPAVNMTWLVPGTEVAGESPDPATSPAFVTAGSPNRDTPAAALVSAALGVVPDRSSDTVTVCPVSVEDPNLECDAGVNSLTVPVADLDDLSGAIIRAVFNPQSAN